MMSKIPDTTQLEAQIAALIKKTGNSLRREQPATSEAALPLRPALDAAPTKEDGQ